MAQRPRIVIALAEAAERGAVAQWLVEEGFDCVCRPTSSAAAEEIQSRPFDLLITDAAFAFGELQRIGRGCRKPAAPVVIVGDALAAGRCEHASWAMYLPRPIDHALLVCTVSMAILDGRPMRQSVRKAVNRFEAIVNGVPAHIIDISNEGVRLEMPRDKCAVPPPYFTVRVPIIGVGVTVQRMWARPWPGGKPEVTWCGGALSANSPRAAGGWRSFVDTVPVAGRPHTDAIKPQ